MKPPSAKTLAKYGLTAKEWLAILAYQGGVCAVCKLVPKSGRLNVDHEHIRDYKKKSPELRRIRVRGLLCFFCNRYYVGRSITAARSRNVTEYLEAHTERVLKYVLSQEAA